MPLKMRENCSWAPLKMCEISRDNLEIYKTLQWLINMNCVVMEGRKFNWPHLKG